MKFENTNWGTLPPHRVHRSENNLLNFFIAVLAVLVFGLTTSCVERAHMNLEEGQFAGERNDDVEHRRAF